MKIEFEFATDIDVRPVSGVAVLYAFDADDPEADPVLLYGVYGDPSSVEAIGYYHVGLRNAEQIFDEDGET